MKNIFSVLLVSIFLFGCSKDDDTSGSIIGVWRVLEKSYSYEAGYIDPVTGDEVIIYSSPLSIIDQDLLWQQYLVFTYDNRLLDYRYYHMVEDPTISVEDSVWLGDVYAEYIYVRDGDSFTFMSEDDPLTPWVDESDYEIAGQIITLTDNDFIYSHSYHSENPYNDTIEFTNQYELHELVKSELP